MVRLLVVLLVISVSAWTPAKASGQRLEIRGIPQLGVAIRHTPRDTWEGSGLLAAVSIEGAIADHFWVSIEPAAWLWAAACDGGSCDILDNSLAAGIVWRPDNSWAGVRAGIAKLFAGNKAWMPYIGVEAEALRASPVGLWFGVRYQPLFQETEFDNKRFDMTRTDFVLLNVGLRVGGRRIE